MSEVLLIDPAIAETEPNFTLGVSKLVFIKFPETVIDVPVPPAAGVALLMVGAGKQVLR